MAEYKAFSDHIKVNRQTVLSIVNSMELGKEHRQEVLRKNGIHTDEKEWFSQQHWLNAFKEIADTIGEMNLFIIGKVIIDNAEFPPVEGLEAALRTIDVAYHMNHTIKDEIMFNPETGALLDGIGHYSLTEFDEAGKKAVMVCNNPYPSKFDEGIILSVTQRFSFAGADPKVVLDQSLETRPNGGDSCTYRISW